LQDKKNPYNTGILFLYFFMIAVIETGGKQYIVKKGDVFIVDRLDETLDSHTFTPLLVSDGTETKV